MAVVQMISCDNEPCSALAPPEEGGTKKKPRAPYGWFKAQVVVEGTGPSFMVMACSLACLADAMGPMSQRTPDEERP